MILGIPARTGRLLRSVEQLFPTAQLAGVDAASEMVSQAMPIFDLVFSTMTYHHRSDQQRGAIEVGRVLTPGVRWVLADFVTTGFARPIRQLLRLTQFPVRPELDWLLTAAGLAVGESGGDIAQHLDLAFGERLQPRTRWSRQFTLRPMRAERWAIDVGDSQDETSWRGCLEAGAPDRRGHGRSLVTSVLTVRRRGALRCVGSLR